MMTPSEIAAQLHPPRLPEAYAQIGWGEALAAFGFGLILAALCLWLARPFVQKRPKKPSLQSQIKSAKSLPAGEQSLALAALLSAQGKSLSPDQRAALYGREGLDPRQIEALLKGGAS